MGVENIWGKINCNIVAPSSNAGGSYAWELPRFSRVLGVEYGATLEITVR